MIRARRLAAIGFLTFVAGSVFAGLATAAELPGPLPQVHALTGVRIVIAPGRTIESGTVVIRDGLIEAAGAEVEPPADARVWDREGLTVYPGLIEPYTTRSWPASDDDKHAPQGGHENSLVTPERDMTLHAVDASAARKLREAGFTTAVVAPDEGIFRGRGVVINLGEGSVHDNLLRRDLAHYVSFRLSQDGYPGSLMGAVALVRQTLYDARWFEQARTAYAANSAQRRPVFNSALEALAGAADGRERIVFVADDVLATLRIAGLVEELGLDAWVVGNGEEYRRLEEVAATGLPHLLPVEFPEAPAVGEEDDLSVGLEDLRHWDLAPENPRRLLDAGVEVAFTGHGLSEPKKIHDGLAAAQERGLTAEEALRATTETPARMLGIDGFVGTVQAGKIANLAVVEGDLFTADPKVREVWIDGRRIEVKESKPPEVDPVGTWSLTVDVGQGQQMAATMEVTGEVGDLAGTISTQSGTLPLASLEVSGKTLELSFDSTPLGMPGTISMKLDIEGDRLSGSGVAPQGSFTIEGNRTAKPEGEVGR